MRHIYIFLLCIFCTLHVGAQEITDNLLIHYPLDGNAIDISGNGYNGLLNASPTMDRFGNENGAMSFNGIDQFIDLPNLQELKPEFPISYSLWVKFDDLDPSNTTMLTNNFSQDNHSGVWLNLSTSGNISAAYGSALGGSGGNNIRYRLGETQIQTDVWYHMVAVYTDFNDIQIYLDCVNDEGIYSGSGFDLGYTTEAGSVGRKDNATVAPYYFDGTMDEFMYWDRALTQDEIDILCSGTLSTSNLSETNDFVLYPNPAEHSFSIVGDGIIGISVYDLAGRKVLESSTAQNVDISIYESGVYLVYINDNSNRITTKRLLIQ